MPLTKYEFSQTASAFFEMPTEMAMPLLPKPLQVLETHHGSSIFAITAFDFTESMVGTYQEVVMSVIVPPLIRAQAKFPKSAFYPFVVGTSTPESRAHALERWHLPHHMADIEIDFSEENGSLTVAVREGDTPIVDFTVTEHEWAIVDHLYQCNMKDDSGRYKVDIHMQGNFCEHEEERGSLTLHDHPMCAGLDAAEITDYPFRELWMKRGRQLFEKLETL
ncbi:MAG: acetoacetate decarboxylase family protein [Gammaproteobacteria bacterium]